MIKTIFDFSLSLIGLVFLSPILCLISLLILISVRTPILFKQKRPGLHGIPFYFYKFRTMTNEKDSNGDLLSENERITKIGNFLRKTSLDELPSLWNVLKGEMSLVGPRPLLLEYLPLYSKNQMKRHNVKPGITGWAQINGRNSISWQDKFKLDIWYVENRTYFLDIKILFLTMYKVMKAENINPKGHTIMPKFKGYKKADL